MEWLIPLAVWGLILWMIGSVIYGASVLIGKARARRRARTALNPQRPPRSRHAVFKP